MVHHLENIKKCQSTTTRKKKEKRKETEVSSLKAWKIRPRKNAYNRF